MLTSALLRLFTGLAAAQLHDQITTAHLVWMNHLDVGYTNTVSSVMNDYFHLYFPKAIATAKAVNVKGEPPIFKYTSHAYLLDMFLDCPTRVGLNCTDGASESLPISADDFRGHGPLRDEEEYGLETTPDDHVNCIICPNASLVRDVIAAVEAGTITWHAYPHNAELELADASLLKEGLASVRRLDARFRSPAAAKQKIVVSQRDVPGLTRGAVPLLAAAGVKAYSVGCNAQITPPAVPGTIFNWADTASNSSILMMLHPRGYGTTLADGTSVPLFSSGEPSTITAPPQCISLQPHRPWSVHDVVTVPGFDEALVYVFKPDNQGPPSADEVREVIKCTALLFPRGARLIGSTFDAFVENLLASGKESSLPVLTAEIGDTWIFGAAADPRRQKLARLMMRARSECVRGGACDASDVAIANFSRFLLKTTEHTFGLHGLSDSTHWDNAAWRGALANSSSAVGASLRLWEKSWEEQRAYLDYARAALSLPSPGATAASEALGHAIDDTIARAAFHAPTTSTMLKVAAGVALHSAAFEFVVSATTGGLTSLTRSGGASAAELVGHDDLDLFQFIYRTSNQKDDFTPFRNNFTGDWKHFPGSWFKTQPGGCYDKIGLDNATCASSMGCAESRDWVPSSVELFADAAGASAAEPISTLVVALTMPTRAATLYGAPDKVWLTLSFGRTRGEGGAGDGAPRIGVDLQWEGKSATRIPEGTCSFMYRYILRESCSQFDSLPLTSLTISPSRDPRSDALGLLPRELCCAVDERLGGGEARLLGRLARHCIDRRSRALARRGRRRRAAHLRERRGGDDRRRRRPRLGALFRRPEYRVSYAASAALDE